MKKIITLLFCLASFNAKTSDLKNDDAKALAEQLQHSINSTVARIIELERSSTKENHAVKFKLKNDSSELQELGLVLRKDGKVIAVTPNSFGDLVGFQSGDYLKKVTVDELALDTTKPIILKVGSYFVANVDRAGNLIELQGEVASENHRWQLKVTSSEFLNKDTVNHSNACGRVSIFARPPETKDFYSVLFNQLNGKNVSQGRNVLRLPPGLHKIKVNELIHARGLKIRRPFMVKGKIIEIHVEPNKTYYLAAEFDSSKRMKSKGEEYWKPIVWKVTERECEL